MMVFFVLRTDVYIYYGDIYTHSRLLSSRRANIRGRSPEGSPWLCSTSADEAEPRCMHAPSMAFPMDDATPSQYVFVVGGDLSQNL